ncbi:MAG: NUDIX domain-containing protein [Nitrococcus sp.]|nr:NUDIX domain-containing protein [Nitrococcus sp.]
MRADSRQYCPQCRGDLISKELGGRSRLACAAAQCGFVFWDNPVPVVAAIVELEGSIVLVRNAWWPKGKFGLLAGYLEPDETAEQGVLREVAEEVGLQGAIQEFVGTYPNPGNNQILLVYHVLIEGEPKLSSELSEIRRLPPVEIQPWPYGTGVALRDWLAKHGYTPARYPAV